jgi:signal transduction histidine kinase
LPRFQKLYSDISSLAWLAEAIGTPRDETLSRLGAVSAMFLPIVARGRALGVMTLVSSRPYRHFDAVDLALEEEVCRRAALAIDNAILFAEAERARLAREELMAVVSHDLRNPLASIATGARLLERAPDGERTYKVARTIGRSAQRMERLTAALLDFAQMQAGHLDVHVDTVDAGTLIHDSLEDFEPVAEERKVSLQGEGFEGSLRCDKDRVLQVLANLVGNALKFTPPGGHVDVRMKRSDKEALFSVSDTGPGIPPDQLGHVWELYWQAKQHAQGGVGLGLSIAKGLVEKQGGRIWVQSTLGQGTTFYFTLPLAPTPMASSPPSA